MITRKEAEQQADQCFMYHVGSFVGVVALMGFLDRRDLPWVAGIWGLGVAAHAAALYACPDSREMLLRTTAGMMEDFRSSHEKHEPQRALAVAR